MSHYYSHHSTVQHSKSFLMYQYSFCGSSHLCIKHWVMQDSFRAHQSGYNAAAHARFGDTDERHSCRPQQQSADTATTQRPFSDKPQQSMYSSKPRMNQPAKCHDADAQYADRRNSTEPHMGYMHDQPRRAHTAHTDVLAPSKSEHEQRATAARPDYQKEMQNSHGHERFSHSPESDGSASDRMASLSALGGKPYATEQSLRVSSNAVMHRADPLTRLGKGCMHYLYMRLVSECCQHVSAALICDVMQCGVVWCDVGMCTWSKDSQDFGLTCCNIN